MEPPKPPEPKPVSPQTKEARRRAFQRRMEKTKRRLEGSQLKPDTR